MWGSGRLSDLRRPPGSPVLRPAVSGGRTRTTTGGRPRLRRRSAAPRCCRWANGSTACFISGSAKSSYRRSPRRIHAGRHNLLPVPAGVRRRTGGRL